MSAGHEGIVERLQAIEEELRDLAYDRLRDSLDSPAVLAEERRIHQARRAIEKAIRLLSAGEADVGPDVD
jgi:hypothetical protein